MTADQRINAAISRARANRDVRTCIRKLEADKEQLLKRGTIIMLGGTNADRDRWVNEYRAICRLINENTTELRSMAA